MPSEHYASDSEDFGFDFLTNKSANVPRLPGPQSFASWKVGTATVNMSLCSCSDLLVKPCRIIVHMMCI